METLKEELDAKIVVIDPSEKMVEVEKIEEGISTNPDS